MIHWHFRGTVATVPQKKLKKAASNFCELQIYHLPRGKFLCIRKGDLENGVNNAPQV